MPQFIRAAAHAAAQTLALQDALGVKRSHLNEVIAALLGYRTHAALTADEADATREYHLEDAEILILNRPMGLLRLKELYRETPDECLEVVLATCQDVLKRCAPQKHVFVGVAQFYDSFAREALADAISSCDDIVAAQADTNAYFPNDPDMDIECPATADLWSANDLWSITADGDWVGRYDPDGDRPFTGDTLNCRGVLTYTKAGRAGLVFLHSEAVGGVDNDWRDQDREDEARYFASSKGN